MISKISAGFEDPSSLEGKTIGTTMGSNTQFFTEALLDEYGVKAEVINVSPPDIVPALARGDIDAGIMFPDFYPAAEEALGDDYIEFRSSAYVAWFVLSATPEMLNERADELAGFVRALVKAEAYIEANPEGAMAALEVASEGLLTMDTIKTKFAEAEYEIGLANGLLDILEIQANWVVGKGLVEAEPSRDAVKAYLTAGPLEAVDASRITFECDRWDGLALGARTLYELQNDRELRSRPRLLTPDGVKRGWALGEGQDHPHGPGSRV